MRPLYDSARRQGYEVWKDYEIINRTCKHERIKQIGLHYMENNYTLKTYFQQYLSKISKLSQSSIKHYMEGMRYIDKYLLGKGKIKSSIFEVTDMAKLNELKAFLENDPDFIALNKRGHQMYSVSFNHYCKFALGDDFYQLGNKLSVLDQKMPVQEKTVTKGVTVWNRSGIIKRQSLEAAGYLCEMNPEHQTFISASNGENYMEGHHLIPIHEQERFDYSLDVYANVVCLCPICHRMLHYGRNSDRTPALKKLYVLKADRLATSGLKISEDKFIEFAEELR